jgi:hypothetical protein
MLKIEKSPKNKKHVEELLDFYEKIKLICHELNIQPIMYGSLIYFAFSRETKYKVNDLDIIIPLKDILKLKQYFEKFNFKIHFIEGWNSLQVFDGRLTIKFDPIEDYEKRFVIKTENFDFYGTKVKGVNLPTLINHYTLASEVSKDKPQEHKRKLQTLERIYKTYS